VTGIGLPELAAATGVEGKKLPWNKDAVATSGYGAALLPEEKCKWFLELWGELRVL
jgi:hypothetical protein